MEHLRPNAIDHSEGHLGPVLGRINMDAKRPLAKWSINDLDDGLPDSTYVGVVGHDSCEGFLDFLAISFIRACFILGEAGLVGRHAGMREVVRALGPFLVRTTLEPTPDETPPRSRPTPERVSSDFTDDAATRASMGINSELNARTLDLSDEVLSTSMFEEIVGSSEAICGVTAQVMRVAPSDATVLSPVRVARERSWSLARFTRGRVDPGRFSPG